jgi:hypothetical protein
MEHAILHALRLKGFADAATLAASLCEPEDDVDTALRAHEGAGLVLHRQGRLSGWALTAEGRRRHHAEVAREVEDPAVRRRIDDVYRRFLPVNKRLLATCTDWQMREVQGRHVLNDHTDDVYDSAVLASLEAVDAAARPLCAELADALPRFATYGPRLANALARVRAGDYDWFTKPVIDSYHTVWFELHEDLLSTLGVERSKEEPS